MRESIINVKKMKKFSDKLDDATKERFKQEALKVDADKLFWTVGRVKELELLLSLLNDVSTLKNLTVKDLSNKVEVIIKKAHELIHFDVSSLNYSFLGFITNKYIIEVNNEIKAKNATNEI
jgi:hypothetical protein